MAARRERRGGVINGPLAYGLGSSHGSQEVWEGMGVEEKKNERGRSRKGRGGVVSWRIILTVGAGNKR